MNTAISRRELTTGALLVATAAAILFAPVLSRMVGHAYDYIVHTELAAVMLTKREVITPHFLFQALALAVHLVFPAPLDWTAFFVVLASTSATAAIIFISLRHEGAAPVMAGVISATLLLSAPVTLLALLDGHLYLGYIATNVFHNPTILLLKPLALLSFMFMTRAFDGVERARLSSILLCAGITVACVLSKPSFTICILPAAVLMMGLSRLNNRTFDSRLIWFGILLPAAVLLIAQYWFTYSQDQISGVYEGKSTIVLAPFAVMSVYSSWLLPKFILSLLFPLAVLLLHLKEAVSDRRLLLAWLAFAFGGGFTYLLAESGPRMYQGNFVWSGQITLFVLFICSALFLLRHYGGSAREQERRWRLLVCQALLLLHAASGIIFYISEYIQTERFW
ncbi:hypothetical protein [Geobacter sp. DSM 9736]|uniref:hypothetical protein n=1 Tax=Geobacter sp. DSM 9736 TaxID=1277350 RepID=UPI000B5022FF|nr:hypothetical protein [Geobacter sp. DSM 9736]SNB46658.1 hypothetical protein SAMN06269301_2126 [Geobacter sp. DSM 9736]